MLPRAHWQQWRLGEPMSTVDLVLVSYVLGELTEDAQHDLVDAGRCRRPAGRRHRRAGHSPGVPADPRRPQRLLAAGWTVAAPCPHQQRCGMTGKDWCHFSARVNRSALHRRLKEAELGYEDEKFSYVALTRQPTRHRGGSCGTPRSARVSSRCRSATRTPRVGPTLVSKREGPRYKAARDAEWGDQWPPHPLTELNQVWSAAKDETHASDEFQLMVSSFVDHDLMSSM